jgi:hypothetical protein
MFNSKQAYIYFAPDERRARQERALALILILLPLLLLLTARDTAWSYPLMFLFLVGVSAGTTLLGVANARRLGRLTYDQASRMRAFPLLLAATMVRKVWQKITRI